MTTPLRLVSVMATLLLLWLVAGCAGGGGSQGPVVGEFVGEVPEADAFVALVAEKPGQQGGKERQIRAFVCDGQGMSEWFAGEASANKVSFSSEGGAKLEAKLTAKAATGTITLSDGGESFDFEAPQATGIDGYYPLTVGEGGAIATSWRGAELYVEIGGGETRTNVHITPPGDEAQEVSFDVFVPTLKVGDEDWRWIVLGDEEQAQIKGSRKGEPVGFIDGDLRPWPL